MIEASYPLRPLMHVCFLSLTTILVLYPFYLVYVIGVNTHHGSHCYVYYGQWGVCAVSHLLLWSTILTVQVALYPLTVERDDNSMEFRLVLCAFTLPLPYDQVRGVRAHPILPCYVRVETSIGTFMLNPSIGVHAFISEYEDARLKTSTRYDVSQRSSTMTAAAVAAVRRASQGSCASVAHTVQPATPKKSVLVPMGAFSDEERDHYLRLYLQALVDGQFRGAKAVSFLMKSGLQELELERIWAIADAERRGFLDFEDFSIAMRLIAHAQSGLDVAPEHAKDVPPDLPRFSN